MNQSISTKGLSLPLVAIIRLGLILGLFGARLLTLAPGAQANATETTSPSPVSNLTADDAAAYAFARNQGGADDSSQLKPIAASAGANLWVSLDGTCDGHIPCYTSIQAAIDAASAYDWVVVLPGTYKENLFLNKEYVTVHGWPSCTIDGDKKGPVVKVENVQHAMFADLTLTNGKADTGGGMYIKNASPQVLWCDFVDNEAKHGGGMYGCTNSAPSVANCWFEGNNATQWGGGMFNGGTTSPSVASCTFYQNTSDDYGGGMFNEGVSPTVDGCRFEDNYAGCAGGGIYNRDSHPEITECQFLSNEVGKGSCVYFQCGYGGGIFNGGEGPFTILGGSSPTITGCVFSGNVAYWGGGLYNHFSSHPHVENCTFDSNEAKRCFDSSGMPWEWSWIAGEGGGVCSIGCSPTFTHCSFSNNWAATRGGGMATWRAWEFDASPVLRRCSFLNNLSDDDGGGMYNGGATISTQDCLLAGNDAGRNGGGMANEASTLGLRNCTMTRNDAEDKGGALYNNYDSDATAYNSIIYGNTANTGLDWHNEDTDSSFSAYSCDIYTSNPPGLANISQIPGFLASSNYHLRPDSPCIDAGNNSLVPSGLTTDLDGNLRITDGDGNCIARVDMGAYETTGNLAPEVPEAPLCEGQTNPTDVTDLTPEFSWTFSDAWPPGDTQSVYRITVQSFPRGAPDMWDSGKVYSPASLNISYGGAPLQWGETYYWFVQTWDQHDCAAPCSTVQEFTMQCREDLAITKSDDPDPVIAGTQLTYDLTVTNNGPCDATGATLQDTLPAGVTYVSCTPSQGTCSHAGGSVTANLGNVANSGNATVQIVVTVNSNTSGSVTNSATVSSDQTDLDPGNNSTSENTTVQTSCDLAITKSDHPDPVTAGTQLTYALTATNNGPSDATAVTVQDTLPAGVTYVSCTPSQGTCSHLGSSVTANLGNIANGGSATVHIVVTVDPSTRELSNTATLSGNDTDPVSSNNSASERTTVSTQADLAISKGVHTPTPLESHVISYTIQVTNNGPSDATNVQIADVLPSGVTYHSSAATQGSYDNSTCIWTVGTIPPGDTETLTLRARVSIPTSGHSYVNTASVHSLAETDPVSGNDSNSASITVIGNPDMTVTKVDALYADNDGDGVPSPGDVLHYTVTINNSGDAAGTCVTFADPINDPNLTLVVGSVSTTHGTVTSGNGSGDTVVGINLGVITAGVTSSITYCATVALPVPAYVSQVSNQGTVSGNNFSSLVTDDPDSGPTDDATVTPITAAPIVEVYKTDWLHTDANGDGQPSPGDTLAYTITIYSTGNENTDSNLTYADPLNDPNLSLDYGSVWTSQGTVNSGNHVGDTTISVGTGTVVGINGIVTITYRISIKHPLQAPNPQVVNQGLVTTGNHANEPSDDPDIGDDDDQTVTPIYSPPLILLTKSGYPSSVPATWRIYYTIRITNTATFLLTNVIVTDTLPAGTYFFSADEWATGAYTLSTVTWQLGTMPIGQRRTLHLVVDTHTTTRGIVTNTVDATATGFRLPATASDTTLVTKRPVPTATPTTSPTATPTCTPTATPTNTPTPTPSPSATPTATATPFGPQVTGSIAVYAWDDLNADGTADSGEPPLAGAFVQVYIPEPPAATGVHPLGTPIASCTTDATGICLFTDLAPGGYIVTIASPGGYSPTTESRFQVTVVVGEVSTVHFGATAQNRCFLPIIICHQDEAPFPLPLFLYFR